MKKVLSFIMMALFAANLYAQNSEITGTVVDTADEPVIGASVLIKGTTDGCVTDIDGNFALKGKKGSVLVISYIGMETIEVTYQGSPLKVTLRDDSQLLEDVVVIGYGTMDKKELTSAIAHVSEKDFLNSTGVDASMMIQGKVPGVSITNTGAADPNNQASIQIRGVSSRNAGLGPLIVIDGIPGGNLTNLNPNDIQSFDILKDGAASAIYGTRGSNGVILITTKKSQKDGHVHTSYNVTTSFDTMIKELDMLSADEYREKCLGNGGYDLGGNDKWLDAVSRTGFKMTHTVTLSGGNAKSNYRISADYRDANGIDKYSGRREYGARASFMHTTNSGLLTFSGNIAPRVANRKNADWAVFRNALEVNPTTPIRDVNNPALYTSVAGQFATFNPVEKTALETNEGITKLIDWDASVKLNLLPLFKESDQKQTLNTSITFGDHQYDNYNTWFRPSSSTLAVEAGRDGQASKSYSKESMYSLEWLVNYSNSWGDHNLKAMAGYSYQYNLYQGMNAENSDFPNDGLGADNLGTGSFAKDEGIVGLGSYKNDSKLIAFFGRVSYDFAGKYLFTASIRHEGSSKFGANHKWGNFPAVSAGWRISEENFMKDVTWVSDLKLRADYGVTGNQNFDSYRSLNTITGFGYYYYDNKYFQVWGPSKNVNPNLKWEKGKNWNIGIDFGLFGGKVSGSINYYNRTQQDLLGDYNVSVPPYLFETTYVNVGTMKNSGFEFDINWNVYKNKNFSYSLGVVGATMSNKFVDFSNSEYVGQDFYDICGTEDPYPMHNLQRIEKGKRLGNFYLLKYAGITPDGQFIVYDKDGDMILANNATVNDYQVCGNGLPQFTGSMTHNFTYKNFDLTLFFRGAFGFDIFNIHDFYYGMQSFKGNVLKKAYGKNLPITGNAQVCDYFLERGDYLKLDMLTLGYTWNFKNKFIERLRLSGTAKNIFTLTCFSGVDPSNYNVNGLNPGGQGGRTYYPSTRQFIVSAHIDF